MSLGIFLLTFGITICVNAEQLTQVESVRVWRAPDHTRVVFDLNGKVEHKLFSLQNPERLVVDLTKAANRASLASLELSKTPITRLRSAKRKQNDLRFVFDLKTKTNPRSFFLKTHAGKPDRLVIDFYDKSTVTEKTIEQVAIAADVSSRRDILIVVDAGHGGEDPGAIGPNRIKEKDVVLDIAKKLVNKINRIEGYKAKLTRTNDYYVPLKKRRDFARKHRADLFVSIHADAFNKSSASGASVFALSLRGATSERARFLARKENDTDLIGGVGDVSFLNKDKTLQSVLVDLSMSATLSSSLDAGKHVLSEMDSIAKLHKKSVEQAGFLVLKSPDVPSILVETGFISNPREAKKLSTSRYREKMASSIFKGIRRYFEKSPPADTYIAWKQKGRPSNNAIFYKVVSGDTLSGIADRYRISLNELKKMNQLSGNEINIGQTLRLQKASTIVQSSANDSESVSQVISHKVVSADTLSEISERYGISISTIKRLNNLKSNSLRIGQTLELREVSLVESVASEDLSPKTTQQKIKTKKLSHKVSNGETLSGIALRYGLTMSQLKELNSLTRDTLLIGQVLLLQSNSAPVESGDRVLIGNKKGVSRTSTHNVKNGETLSGIALRYNTTMVELKRMNKLSSNEIFIGQRLIVSQSIDLSLTKTRIHKVMSGDTLSGIALRYSSSVTKIKKYNKLANNALQIGQELQIPINEG